MLNLKSTNGHPIYLLVNGPCHIDQNAIDQVLQQVEASNPVFEEGEPYVVQYSQAEAVEEVAVSQPETDIKHEIPDGDEIPMPQTANNAEVFASVSHKVNGIQSSAVEQVEQTEATPMEPEPV